MDHVPVEQRSHDPRRRTAALVSLLAGTAIFTTKLIAWMSTGSSAILSDALESVVNVIAAGFALFAVRFAEQPADRDHPYGHGKIELLSAAFEGGLVFFAAVTIGYTAVRAFFVPPELHALDFGLALTSAAAVANLALGVFLLRIGRATESPTLVADGHHVLSDVWTTGGAIIGVVLVRFTHVAWIDPAVALVLAGMLARTGARLVLESADGLLDREDPALILRIVEAFRTADVPGIGTVHRLRAIRSGHVVHVDAHVFVPISWTVVHAHDAVARLEAIVQKASGLAGLEIALHFDPVADDAVGTLATLTVEEATGIPRKR
jgi:cation diffusion facilitator family transporter